MGSESFKDVEHKELIEQGEVPEVLSKLVRKYDIDLIVIGTGGRKGLEKLLLGSVAEEVFRNAECPVLTVGPHVIAVGHRWQPAARPVCHRLRAGVGARAALRHIFGRGESGSSDPAACGAGTGVALPEPEPGSHARG